jgi:hypothetical protein
MSKKILIDLDAVKDLLHALDQAQDFLNDANIYEDYFTQYIHGFCKLLKEAEKHKYSAVEWHSVGESPRNGAHILVRIKGLVFPDSVFYYDDVAWITTHSAKENVSEWAYLPE